MFIHCSASNRYEHDDVAVIEKWHRERWPELCATECGYHWFIPTSGELQASRSLERIPVAQQGHNSHTLTICLHGLFEDDFTDRQLGTLRQLCREIRDAYGGYLTFHGHCEVSNKTCPVFDYQRVLGLDLFGRMGDGPIVFPTLKVGSKGLPVAYLQERLGLDVDAIYGEDTRLAVFRYQKAAAIEPDGIVGPQTWGTLVTIDEGKVYERGSNRSL